MKLKYTAGIESDIRMPSGRTVRVAAGDTVEATGADVKALLELPGFTKVKSGGGSRGGNTSAKKKPATKASSTTKKADPVADPTTED